MSAHSHYKHEAHDRSIPICPSCGSPATERETRYGLRNQCDPCGLWSWDRHPLVDAETHEARKAAHAAFDLLWKDGTMKRGQAYRRLAAVLEIDPADCHIKLMDKTTALRVPAAALVVRFNRAPEEAES